MNALIVEDEIAAQRNLCKVLSQVAPHIKIVGTTDSITDTVEYLLNSPSPDVIFMDIHLADGHAFHIFEIVEVKSPVIFTTAYDAYALEAFKLNSIDYLLKPIVTDDVVHALHKLKVIGNTELIDNLKKGLRTEEVKPFLISFRDKLIPVSLSEIAYIYSSNEHVQLTLTNEKSYPLDKSLDSYMAQLPIETFYRANRQYIISRQAIRDIDIWLGNRLCVNLSVGIPERIIISKNRVSEFKMWISGK